jgi:hypothetical protein
MKKTPIVLIILSLLVAINVSAQQKEQQKQTSVVERRYPGGNLELRTFLARSARFPEYAAENNIVGLSLSSCAISPDGNVERVEIINSLGEAVDKEVRRLLHRTSGKWKKARIDTTEVFYFQLCLYLSPIEWHRDTIRDYNILEPIIITAVPFRMNRQERERYSDQYIAESINQGIKNEDYHSAIESIDEAIRRNPYNLQLYQLRIMINSKIGNSDMVQEDALKMRNFVNGKPLEYYIGGE